MSSKRSGSGNESNKMHQSSLFRYTRAKPRKSTVSTSISSTPSTINDEDVPTSRGKSSFRPSSLPRSSSNRGPPSTSQASTSTLGSTSTGTSRNVKENRAPTAIASEFEAGAHSSPIPGLAMPEDLTAFSGAMHRRIQSIYSPGHEHGFGASEGTAHTLPKRKTREWVLDEAGESERTKRRRKSSTSSSTDTHPSFRKFITNPTRLPENSTTNPPPSEHESKQHRFLIGDPEIELIELAGSGPIIESSQSQPLLTPERLGRRLDRSSPLPQSSPIGDLIRSSQSPSPLKSATPRRGTQGVPANYVLSPLKNPLVPSPPRNIGLAPDVSVKKRRRAPGTLVSGLTDVLTSNP